MALAPGTAVVSGSDGDLTAASNEMDSNALDGSPLTFGSMMNAMVRIAVEKIKQVHQSALQGYIEEVYAYNFSKLVAAEAKLQANGRPEEIKTLYTKYFGGTSGKVGKELVKMLKRVDKHLNEDSTKVKLKRKIRVALVSKLETCIRAVLPN